MSCHRLIDAEKPHHQVSRLCRVLGVARAGYYAWAAGPPSQRTLDDAYLRKRVARLMREHGLQGVHRRRRHAPRPAGVPNSRSCRTELHAGRPDRLWVADITQQRTGEGWLYLAVVLDAFSRRVVGWSMADHLRTELVLDALEMAIVQRNPTAGWCITAITTARTPRSPSAVAESFLATLECELLDRDPWPTRTGLRTAIFDFIEVFYNRQRRHSTLDYHPPATYEQHHASAASAA